MTDREKEKRKVYIGKYHSIESIETPVEFATPAFLGGADQTPELRAEAFKAGLRYWWRVLYGGKHGDQIRKEENYIFGSIERASKVRVLISGDENIKPVNFDSSAGGKIDYKGRCNIINYLAFGHVGSTVLPCGKEFMLQVFFPKDQSIKKQILGALKAFFIFGGVGARSRNGFGSLYSKSLNEIKCDLSDLGISDKLCSFPVLSRESKVFLIEKEFPRWEDALSEIGQAYRSARLGLDEKHHFDKRGLLARPIEAKKESVPLEIKNGRFPKQLFMKVQKQNGKFKGQILVMPIKFYKAEQQSKYNAVIEDITSKLKKQNLQLLEYNYILGLLEGGK